MKTLISWIAKQNDFTNGQVNTNGPTCTFHRFYFNCDRHILLATTDSETQLEFLGSSLKNEYPFHQLEPRVMAISDLGDLHEVKTNVESLYVFCDGAVKPDDLPLQVVNPAQESVFDLKTIEKLHIEKVFRHFKGNKRQTAMALGITINTLNSKLDEIKE